MKGGEGVRQNIYRHMLEMRKLTKNKSHDDPKSSLMSYFSEQNIPHSHIKSLVLPQSLKRLNFLHLLSDGDKYVNQYSSGGGFSFTFFPARRKISRENDDFNMLMLL